MLLTVPLLVLGGLTTIAPAASVVTVTAGTPTGPTITYTESTPLHGGTGGTASQVLCSPDSALTGLTLISDGSTFASQGFGAGLAVYCTQVDTSGALVGAPVLAGTVRSTDVTTASGNYPTSCPTGSVVTGDQGRAGTLIDAVQVNCMGLSGGVLSGGSSGAAASSPNDPLTATSGGVPFGPDNCLSGSFAIGVDARSGQDLDALDRKSVV